MHAHVHVKLNANHSLIFSLKTCNKSATIGFVGPQNFKIHLLKRKFASFEPIRTAFAENPGQNAEKINIEFGENSTIQFDGKKFL